MLIVTSIFDVVLVRCLTHVQDAIWMKQPNETVVEKLKKKKNTREKNPLSNFKWILEENSRKHPRVLNVMEKYEKQNPHIWKSNSCSCRKENKRKSELGSNATWLMDGRSINDSKFVAIISENDYLSEGDAIWQFNDLKILVVQMMTPWKWSFIQ